ncbi:translation initiation factor IF-2-like isoform X2 [Aquila chrysaetos chrysaetos]|uniref:translation initiation factor IF-2-like isoform X2 n=1 Tax=Aquila chrysaetos chrysaetos TaxID=223781 RepID=UPI001B7D4681|nr:translation initiation factor IF-2-like isoform X2 [Aquila chrysaetos chrysaetos]
MRVLHGPAAPLAGPARLCSTSCGSCTALQRCLQVLHGPQHRVQVLHGPAALFAGLVWPCSAGCWSCMAPQRWVLVLHSPAAPFASPAWPCSAGCKRYTALQHQVQILHSRAAPLVSLVGPCSTVCGPCTTLQRRLGAWRGPAAGFGGSRRAPPRRTGLAQRRSASLGPSQPRGAFHGPGPSRLCSTVCRPGAALARPRRFLHLPRAPAAGTPRPVPEPVPEPVPAGSRFPSRHNWKGARAAPGSARWCRGHVGSSAAAAGGGGDRGDAWGKSSVFNVPDSHLFLKQTDKFCCTALDETVKTKKKA